MERSTTHIHLLPVKKKTSPLQSQGVMMSSKFSLKSTWKEQPVWVRGWLIKNVTLEDWRLTGQLMESVIYVTITKDSFDLVVSHLINPSWLLQSFCWVLWSENLQVISMSFCPSSSPSVKAMLFPSSSSSSSSTSSSPDVVEVKVGT